MPFFSRREFLKLAVSVPISAAVFPWLSNWISQSNISQNAHPQNILIFLFDAMTARDLSVYGYPRDTTPNLRRFANRANIYHSHYSAGNFTVPGTTSLLTGLYPWTHRAINEGGAMAKKLTDRNIFRSMGDNYQHLAFAQNIWANFILDQFQQDIDVRLSPESFSVANGIMGDWLQNDTVGYRALDDFLFKFDNTHSNAASLIFGPIQRLLVLRQIAKARDSYSEQYPSGLPQVDNYPLLFSLEEIFDGTINTIRKLGTPTFAYFHFFPPHDPYRPNNEFNTMFKDKYRPLSKSLHPLSHGISQTDLNRHRRRYDQYIANIDFHFGLLLDALEQSGLFDNSIIVVTGDHGESFERGEQGHETPLMYDPLLRIPLLISTPQQNTRNDFYQPTNSVDVLPTLVHLAGQSTPTWCEGGILPGLGGQYDSQRSTFSIEAKLNSAHAPIKNGTIAMRKGMRRRGSYINGVS